MKLAHGSLVILLHAGLAFANQAATPPSPVLSAPVASVSVGQVPPALELSDKRGGLVKGNLPWNSTELQQGAKVSILFYVAPSQKDLNEAISDALKEAKFPEEKFQSIAVVNMAASSWPNFMIESKLKASQEEFPRTRYIKDKEKVFVKEWQLEDDSSNVVLFDRKGVVLFVVKGKATPQQVTELLTLIRTHL